LAILEPTWLLSEHGWTISLVIEAVLKARFL